MKKICLLLLLVRVGLHATAQTTPLEDSLKKQLSHARTIPDKMRWMNELGQYYIGINNTLSDEYEAQILVMADSSRNREWMARAYLYNADRYYAFSYLQQSISKGLECAQKALDIARDNNLNEWAVWSYMYLARAVLKNGENDKALNYNNMALSMASDIANDSLQTYLYSTLGDTYLARNEKLLAFRNYLQALNIAEQSDKYDLLRECYSRLADFYRSLDEYEKAKDYEFRKEALQQQFNRPYDLLNTYNEIGDLYSFAKQYDQALKYYEKSMALAKSLHFEPFNINCYISIVNLYLNSGQNQKGLDYFNTHTELKSFFKNSGMGFFIDQAYGAIYTVLDQLDSAGYYLKKAEPGIENNVNLNNKFWYYFQVARYYRKKGDFNEAIAYLTKAKTVMEQIGSLSLLQYTTNHLDSLYQLKGDFKTAYHFHTLSSQYKDSLQKLSKEKDLLSVEIANENKRKEREAKKQEEETLRRHNIQYMGITIGIACTFMLLVVAGVFSVSRSTIKILGFFAFIFLFEFIILIADNKIHDITHGEPWKVLAIKIGLIAILLPLHHRLEEKVIHYLTTQELLRLKRKKFMGRWFGKKDADVPMRNV